MFPPHSTHSLQPLDVVLFSPLSRNYTTQLNRNSQRSQGVTKVKKSDLYSSFWAVWSFSMRQDTILKSFQATGVWPMDAEVVIKRFNNHTSEQDEASRPGQHGDSDSWGQLRKFFDAAVADKATIEAKRLSQSMHSLQVNNALLHDQNESLQQEPNAKTKTPMKRMTLATQDGDDWHGGAVFWSPRRLRRARQRKAAEPDEAEQLQPQKSHNRDLKAAVTAYKEKQQEAAKVAQKGAAEERRELKKARAAELAAERALKKQQRDAVTAGKSRDTANTSK